jgi:hypothetical protein
VVLAYAKGIDIDTRCFNAMIYKRLWALDSALDMLCRLLPIIKYSELQMETFRELPFTFGHVCKDGH